MGRFYLGSAFSENFIASLKKSVPAAVSAPVKLPKQSGEEGAHFSLRAN